MKLDVGFTGLAMELRRSYKGVSMGFQWIFKVIYETLATPLTYILVNKVKAHEAMDVYEDEFSVNPFSV